MFSKTQLEQLYDSMDSEGGCEVSLHLDQAKELPLIVAWKFIETASANGMQATGWWCKQQTEQDAAIQTAWTNARTSKHKGGGSLNKVTYAMIRSLISVGLLFQRSDVKLKSQQPKGTVARKKVAQEDSHAFSEMMAVQLDMAGLLEGLRNDLSEAYSEDRDKRISARLKNIEPRLRSSQEAAENGKSPTSTSVAELVKVVSKLSKPPSEVEVHPLHGDGQCCLYGLLLTIMDLAGKRSFQRVSSR